MRLFANNLSPCKKISTVYARDKNGKAVESFHVPATHHSGKDDTDAYNRFKVDHTAYFASNEHVSQGPFALNFGSVEGVRIDSYPTA